MIIGIDYDSKRAANTANILALIKTIKAHGHTVVVVTKNQQEEGVHKWIADVIDEIIYDIGDKDPRECVARLGFEVDVWIDDTPVLPKRG